MENIEILSLTQAIDSRILGSEFGIAEVIGDIFLTHLIHGDHNGGVVEVVPQTGVGDGRPCIQRHGGMGRRRHEDDVQVIVAKEREVHLGRLGAADVEIEKTLKSGSWLREKGDESLEGRDERLSCSAELLQVILGSKGIY